MNFDNPKDFLCTLALGGTCLLLYSRLLTSKPRACAPKVCQRVVGITGTLGAGKGTIVDLLTKEEGFVHYSVRSYLIECIEQRGMPVNRDSMTQVANELRAANSPSYIVEQLHNKAVVEGKDCIIESIRTVGEVNALRALGNFYLLAVDADPATRYDRAFARGSETDSVSFETFISNEQREMGSDDPNKQNLGACMKLADFKFNNDGTEEELYQQVRKALKEMK
jgi:dephospho-CoA kinase